MEYAIVAYEIENGVAQAFGYAFDRRQNPGFSVGLGFAAFGCEREGAG
jgi:hypothetical protein